MKKVLSTLLLVVCCWLAIPAQAQVHFGLKGGLDVSKLSCSNDLFKGENRTGFFIGPMMEFTLPIVGIGIDAAALYSQSGLKLEENSESETLKTIEIPINLKWTFGLGSTLGVYLAAGPQQAGSPGAGPGIPRCQNSCETAPSPCSYGNDKPGHPPHRRSDIPPLQPSPRRSYPS